MKMLTSVAGAKILHIYMNESTFLHASRIVSLRLASPDPAT